MSSSGAAISNAAVAAKVSELLPGIIDEDVLFRDEGTGRVAEADLPERLAPGGLSATIDEQVSPVQEQIETLALDYADGRLARQAYDLTGFTVAGNVATSNGWVSQHLTEDGKRVIGSKRSTKELGVSVDNGATFTVVETFPMLIRDLELLPTGELLVAVCDDGQACDLYLSNGWGMTVASATAATFTKVFDANLNELSVYPAYDYQGITFDEDGHVWVAFYGAKTDAGSGNLGGVRVIRSDNSGSTWVSVFRLDQWLANVAGKTDVLTWGYHLHSVVWDPYWSRVWLTFGDSNGANGLNGVLYSDDLGATWAVAYTNLTLAGLGYTGDHQVVAIYPMRNGIVLQNDGNGDGGAYTWFLRRRGYRTLGTTGPTGAAPLIENGPRITTSSGSPAIGRQPFKLRNVPGAPLLLPITQFSNRSAGQGLSRLQATVDGVRFYTMFTDPSGPLLAYGGMITALGPTPDNKLICTHMNAAGDTLQTLTVQLSPG